MKLYCSSCMLPCIILGSNKCFTQGRNMNKADYHVSNSNAFRTEYDDDRKFFEVYSNPIQSLYSQVHWIGHGDIPLPPDVVEQFAGGSAMAITGYEVDQVMTDPTGIEVSVPITWAYNHHYGAYLLNSNTAKMVKVPVTKETEALGMHHGAKTLWRAHILDEDDHDLPQVQFFSEGNGGEMRMSYHGYPNGYAQIIQSPDTFHVTPMQIDTWNRNMKNATFMPGPMPMSSQIPSSAGYNALLECPCTTRMRKEFHMTYQRMPSRDVQTKEAGQDCTGSIKNQTECFLAAPTVIPANNYKTQTSCSAQFPAGCSVSLGESGDLKATWNKYNSTPSVRSNENIDHVVGVASNVINMTLSIKDSKDPRAVEIVFTGPSEKWFGVGFGSHSMCVQKMAWEECSTGGPYAIIIRGETVEERKLDYHGPGHVLSNSLKVISNTVSNGVRIVHVSRSITGETENHFDFDPSVPEIEVIMATGCGTEFKQHCGHGTSKVILLAVDTPVELCQAGIEGTIGGEKFERQCAPYPLSELVSQQNPTCTLQTYQGGLSCCRHNHFLLDEDQEVPWINQTLEYRLKFRFYYEKYQTSSEGKPASHQNLVRFYMQTEAFAGEYDVPRCVPGTPPSQCVHTITSRFKVKEMIHDCKTVDASWCTGEGSGEESKSAGIQLIYAGPHCHAPSCLSMELYNADTGRLVCHVEPILGKSNSVFDENGFLSIPPCLWGDTVEGLPEPVFLSLNTTLLSIKRNNNTYAHTGEMASWQMRGIVVPRELSTSTMKSMLHQNKEDADIKTRRHLRYDLTGDGI